MRQIDEARIMRDFAVALERGYVDAHEWEAYKLSGMRERLKACPDVRHMLMDDPIMPIEVTPEGRWEYE